MRGTYVLQCLPASLQWVTQFCFCIFLFDLDVTSLLLENGCKVQFFLKDKPFVVRACTSLGCDTKQWFFYPKLNRHELFLIVLLSFLLQMVGICYCHVLLLLLPLSPPTNCTICFVSYPFNFVMSLWNVTHKGKYYYITRKHYFIFILFVWLLIDQSLWLVNRLWFMVPVNNNNSERCRK